MTRRRRSLRRMLPIATLLLSTFVGGLGAQEPPERRGSRDRAQIEERVRAQMARLVRERLGLSEDEAGALGAVVREHEQRRRALRRSEVATRRRIEALLLEGPDEEEQVRALLDRLVELRREEAELFAEEQGALLEVLTPAQVLQLHALREEMGERIRRLRRGDRRRRPGGEHGNVDGLHGVPLTGW